MNIDVLRHRAANVKWWHGGIDLGYGVLTEGTTCPALSLLPHLGLLDDLSGKSVLDIGAWDGFMSFECERRGAATVIAVDSVAWDRKYAGTPMMPHHHTGQDGFNLAHEARQSRVIPVKCEVLDLIPSEIGTFDIVLFLGVLYHMRHPLLSLEKVAALTDDLLIVETYTEHNGQATPTMHFYPGAELNNDVTNWWGPNPACVIAMLRDVGFQRIDWNHSVGARAVFRAYKEGKP